MNTGLVMFQCRQLYLKDLKKLDFFVNNNQIDGEKTLKIFYIGYTW